MAANGTNGGGNGGFWQNTDSIYNDPQACKSYIGEYPSSHQLGESGRRYTYLNAPQQQQQQPPPPPPQGDRINANQQGRSGPNISGQSGGNYQCAASQKPNMQAWLNSTTDHAPSYYISFGGTRRQN